MYKCIVHVHNVYIQCVLSYDFSASSITFAQDLVFSFSFRPLSSNYLSSFHLFIFFMYIFILDHDYDVDTSKVLG